ncbi:MAG: hypothetical protein D6711_10820, partial [Chloroflexi bacterium]
IEGITLYGTPVPLDEGFYQETNPEIRYTGTWATFTGSNLSGGAARSGAPNAEINFLVTGNAVTLYHRRDTGVSRNVEFCVIPTVGSPVCTNYNLNGSPLLDQVPITIYGLGEGTHTIRITNKDASYWLVFDAIQVH